MRCIREANEFRIKQRSAGCQVLFINSAAFALMWMRCLSKRSLLGRLQFFLWQLRSS